MINVLERLDSLFPQERPGGIGRILLVDNGSTDGTLEAVLEFVNRRNDPRFRVLRNQENYSLGGSTIVAFRESIREGLDFLICMHSDGQADPADLSAMIANSKPGIDLVLGSRLLSGSRNEEYSKLRLFVNHVFAWLQRVIIRANAKDLGSFISFNLKTIATLPYARLPHDMGYQPLLVLYAFRARSIRFVEIPISWGKVEESNINPFVYATRHLYRLSKFMLGRFPLSDKAPDDFQSSEVYRHGSHSS